MSFLSCHILGTPLREPVNWSNRALHDFEELGLQTQYAPLSSLRFKARSCPIHPAIESISMRFAPRQPRCAPHIHMPLRHTKVRYAIPLSNQLVLPGGQPATLRPGASPGSDDASTCLPRLRSPDRPSLERICLVRHLVENSSLSSPLPLVNLSPLE